MIKTKKGQVIVLDVLFAIVLIILMFFLLIKFSEIEIYKTNYDRYTEKLNNAGVLAYQQVLNNPQINCKVADSINTFYIPGTIRTTDLNITKEKLGIPSDFNCSFSVVPPIAFPVNDCNQTANPEIDTYNIDFNIVTCVSDLKKVDYFNYINKIGTPPTTVVAQLKVWRNDK